MYRRMLVLLDGSKLAEVVFSYARELAGRLSLDLDLLHVCTPQETALLPMRDAYVQHMAEILKAQSEEIREQSSGSRSKKSIEARGKVIVGYPPEEILKYTSENAIDIIMMATHGVSGITRWGLGNVADKVIHESNVPVWLIPAELREEIIYDKLPRNMILVPLDGSKLAEGVIPHVLDLTKQRGVRTEIMLINVAKPAPSAPIPANRHLIGENITAFETTGEVYLRKVTKKLGDAGLKTYTEQLIGDPAEEIVRYAAKHHPRLIAMSTHGRSGLSKFVFGSVTENVLHRLRKTPLFLVRPVEPKS